MCVYVCVQAGSGSPTMATNNQDFQRSESDRLNEVKGHLEIALLEKHFLREYAQKPHLPHPYYCNYYCHFPRGGFQFVLLWRYCCCVERHTWKWDFMIVVYFKIFHFSPKKVRCPLLLGRPVAKLRLRPRCWSHACQNQCPVGGILDVLYCAGLLIVCNRLWSLPLCPTVSKRVGACEWETEYLRLFPFTLPLPELQRRDSLSHGRSAL